MRMGAPERQGLRKVTELRANDVRYVTILFCNSFHFFSRIRQRFVNYKQYQLWVSISFSNFKNKSILWETAISSRKLLGV